SIPSAREHHAGDRGGRTSLPSPIRLDGGVPFHVAGPDIQRLQSTIWLLKRIVHAGAIRRAAPYNQSGGRRRLRFPQPGSPQELAVAVRIERDRHAALARGQQDVSSSD